MKEVTTYDYRTIRVRREMEAMTTDAYENLGWEFVGSSVFGASIFHVNLSFKRDRKIANKQQLLKLQEKVDGTLTNVEVLQNKKRSAGIASSIGNGIVGTLAFGGGLSMMLLLGVEPVAAGWLVGGIVLGLVGIAICSFSWFINRKVKTRAISKIDPMLEQEYNRLSDICDEIKPA